jgi:hypothetical protein
MKSCLKNIFEQMDSIFCRPSKQFNEIDKYLKDTLIIFVEIYHFFLHQNNSKQKLSLDFKKKNSIYNLKNYWKNIVDMDSYMKNKILSSFELVVKVLVINIKIFKIRNFSYTREFNMI